MDLQLDKLCAMWGPQIGIPKKKDILKVASKKVALRTAFTLHLQFLRNGTVPVCAQIDNNGNVLMLEMTVDAWHEDEDIEMEDGDEED